MSRFAAARSRWVPDALKWIGWRVKRRPGTAVATFVAAHKSAQGR